LANFDNVAAALSPTRLAPPAQGQPAQPAHRSLFDPQLIHDVVQWAHNIQEAMDSNEIDNVVQGIRVGTHVLAQIAAAAERLHHHGGQAAPAQGQPNQPPASLGGAGGY
jgi:hypothetical protein